MRLGSPFPRWVMEVETQKPKTGMPGPAANNFITLTMARQTKANQVYSRFSPPTFGGGRPEWFNFKKVQKAVIEQENAEAAEGRGEDRNPKTEFRMRSDGRIPSSAPSRAKRRGVQQPSAALGSEEDEKAPGQAHSTSWRTIRLSFGVFEGTKGSDHRSCAERHPQFIMRLR